MRLSKIIPASAALFALAAGVVTLPSAAHADRYAEKPPVMLSPGLTQPWVMQLQGDFAGQRTVQQVQQPKRGLFGRPQRQKTVRAASIRAAQPAVAPKPKARAGLNPLYLPTTVNYSTSHKPGSIVIDTASKHLYFILPGGKARRYGVGVGKEGFEWSGTQRITRKAKWPGWTPPKEMIAREKAKGRILPAHMPGGPENPLGARALYLGSTLYRIHGTNQPWTIGKALSSGCIRMRNQDVTALYEQVQKGAKVVVL